MSNSNKPIRRGFSDPTEIPYYCKKCDYYCSVLKGSPYCSKREDGRFSPEVAFTCYKMKKVPKETKPEEKGESDKN